MAFLLKHDKFLSKQITEINFIVLEHTGKTKSKRKRFVTNAVARERKSTFLLEPVKYVSLIFGAPRRKKKERSTASGEIQFHLLHHQRVQHLLWL